MVNCILYEFKHPFHIEWRFSPICHHGHRIPNRQGSCMIRQINGVVITIRVHIETGNPLTCTHIFIRIDEPTESRIIISRIEIIESGLHIEVITAVAYGVNVSDGNAGVRFAVGIQNVYELAPRIIDVLVSRL